jgi:putative ABC transport system ATP-binding protein
MLIQFQNVSKRYQSDKRMVDALDDVSFQLDAGQFIAVRGPSGCGKSTLLMTAGGLQRPDSGRVEVDGSVIYDLSPDQRAKIRASKLGFVFQQFHLVPYLNVLDNVLAAALALKTPDANERAHELIEQFGLTSRIQHTPAELSTGERQRTALARAMLNEPQIVLADEPTGNLDEENALTVLSFLKQFVSDGGAVLLVTHDQRAADFAQETIQMQDGKILELEPTGAGESANA